VPSRGCRRESGQGPSGRLANRQEYKSLYQNDGGERNDGTVAQRLEQGTHNPLVAGSNPAGPIANLVVNAHQVVYSHRNLLLSSTSRGRWTAFLMLDFL
jgi:hypothetical protein